jgi:hypothetical protein
VVDVLVAEESGEDAAIYGEPRVVADAEDLPLVRRELAGGSDLAEIGDAAGCVCGEVGEELHGGWTDNSSVGAALDG